MKVRALLPADWPRVSEIYREGIESGNATFATTVPEWDEWNESRHPTVRIVVVDAVDDVEDGRVIGFATVSPVSKRPVYAGVAEVMVYVAASARGRGVGSRLLAALVAESEAAGIWTLQAGIFPENVASIRAHERVGFRLIGRHERIGHFHDGRWRDTVLLERRSTVVGID